jgi:hypothetical protein
LENKDRSESEPSNDAEFMSFFSKEIKEAKGKKCYFIGCFDLVWFGSSPLPFNNAFSFAFHHEETGLQ